MTQYLSVDAAPPTAAPERKAEDRPTTVWLLIVSAAIIAVGAIFASLTPDQRIQAYLQAGVFP